MRQIDAKCGNTLWWDAVCKEMKNVRPAFEVFEGGIEQLPSRYQEIKCHKIFDVKVGENYRRKAWLVAGGHTTEAPARLPMCRLSHVIQLELHLPLRHLTDWKS